MATIKDKHIYYEAVGRRKTASARVRFEANSKGLFLINGRELGRYFMSPELSRIAKEPMRQTDTLKNSVSVMVHGGGIHAQAEAVALGLARALILWDKDFKIPLKQNRHLRRDPRMKERRKFGLKKARKAPQWSKR